MKNKNDIKFILLQVVLTLLIAFLPIYFYINASIENQNIKDKLSLKNYALSLNSKIVQLENENSDIFYYPRSTIFNSGIYDDNDEIIFSLLPLKNSFNFDSDFYESNNNLCYKEYLNNNILNAKYLIVCKEIDNSQVIYNIIILLITLTCLIFLSSFFIIKQSIEPYKKLNTYLDNFFKDAMHELKTPLGVARINIDLLQSKTKEDKYTLRIKSALKNMSVIYDDLEYFVQRKVIREEKTHIDFSSYLKKRVEFFSDLAKAKKIALNINIEDDISIKFNEIQLQRIIDNNLSNAIKYSKDNSQITIILKKSNSTILLKFIDKGIGIKDTSKIFERYYRGDKISGGFGIGLSIVKQICIKNDIKIDIISELNNGSCFSYLFKLNQF